MWPLLHLQHHLGHGEEVITDVYGTECSDKQTQLGAELPTGVNRNSSKEGPYVAKEVWEIRRALSLRGDPPWPLDESGLSMVLQ